MLRRILEIAFASFLLPSALLADVAKPEALPPAAKVVRLKATPEAVVLDGPFRYAQLQLTAELEGGETLDVGRMAAWTLPKGLVTITAGGQVRPGSTDGAGSLTATLGGVSIVIPVTVRNAKSAEAISFVKDVQPALSKMGCNQGTCHGSAQGKNGFKLSLRGYDPIFDHRALTDDIEGRRFNRAAPERSLMLLKPTGAVPHTGGVTMNVGDANYEMIRRWIADGVKQDLAATRVRSIEVIPKTIAIAMPGQKQQFSVIATYTDGTTRDVSAEAFIEGSNIETVSVDKSGLMTALRRGEATMLARYDGAYAASSVVIMGDRTGFAWKQQPVFNEIDTFVDAKLKKLKVDVSELCTDADFLRRVSIDLTGLPPTADEVRAFLADSTPSRTKRDAVVDRLVGSEAFVEHWTNKWADLLQVNRKFLGEEGASALRKWIRNAIATNVPYDQFAYSVLTAVGSNVDNPPAGYFKVLRAPDALMENTTQLFMAIRFNCNKCHDHPFEKWTQDQYYELSAYFAQIDRNEDPKFKGRKIGGSAVEGAVPLSEVITDAKAGEIKNERTGTDAKPKFPFVHASMPVAEPNRRTLLAKWLTHKDNPYFAKSYANRLWSYLTGVGVIEPIDDIRAGNPPTNPELLEFLTKSFIESKFDSNSLIKTICKSRTYQLSIASTKFNKDDDQNYSHATPRRLSAEVLFDGIHRVTGSQSRLPGLPAGSRAAQLVDGNVDLPGGFLELFGKPVRESACECERSNTMMLGPVLAMVNGPIVAEAVKDPAGRLSMFTAATKDDAKVVEEIYLSVLNRLPTDGERKYGIAALNAGKADFDRLKADHDRKVGEFKAYEATLPKLQAAWEAGNLAVKPTTWTTLTFKTLKAAGGGIFTRNDDGSYSVTGPVTGQELYTLTAETKLKNLTGIRLEVLADAKLPAKGPGRAENGNFVLNEFKLNRKDASKPDEKPKPVKFVDPKADFEQGGFPIAHAVDGNAGTGWAVSDKFGVNHMAVLPIQGKIATKGGEQLTFVLDQRYGSSHVIGRFRISTTEDAKPSLTSSVSPELVKLLETPEAERTPAMKTRLRQLYLATDRDYDRYAAAAAIVPPSDARVVGAQDLVWALMNSPAFLFNR